jgi:epoxyqueuosine reductase QueG
MPLSKIENAREIKRIARNGGAAIVGFADLERLNGIFTFPSNLLSEFKYGICVAISLEQWGKFDSSTEDGFAFPRLKQIAKNLKSFIEKNGYSSRIVVPDKRVSRSSPLYWRGEISHKALAKTAGLGWIGRSTLLITRDFGPRVCLVTVLTDMPLPAGKPTKNKCGKCEMCVRSCPARAIRYAEFDDHPRNIEDAVDVDACGSWVAKTWREGTLCFECLLACPKGKYKSTSHQRR